MKYDIIESYDSNCVTNEVNARLAQGWRPIGGIAVTSHPYSPTNDMDPVQVPFYAQAIVYNGEPTPADRNPTVHELEIFRHEGKIWAIKAHRSRTGLGLKESKEAIEDAVGRLGISRPERKP